MKALKYAVYAVGGLVALAVVALVAAALFVNGELVKGKLEAAMQERNRTLKIEGTPAVSLFPVLRLVFGKTSLSEPNSEKNFATLESLDVAVRVMPLLSREVAVEALALKGLRLNVVRARDGSFNFGDLTGPKQPEAAPAGLPKVRVAEVRIEGAHIAYSDQASGRTLAIDDVNILTGRLADDTPTPLRVSASISGKSPEVALKTQVSASARVNLVQQSFAFAKLDARVTGNADTLRGLDLRVSGDVAADARRQEYAINALSVQMKGTFERDALSGALDAPSLRITSSKAEGKAVTGTFSVRGPQRTVDAKLNMAAVEGSASTLTVPALVVDFSGEVGGNVLKGEVTTPIKANLKEGVWELAKIAATLTLGRPDTALKAQLAGAATVNPAKQMVAVTGLDAVATGSYDTLKGLDLKFSGNVGADGIKNEYTADKVTLQAKGTLDRDAFTASFQAPKLRVTPSKAEGQAVTGAVSVKGPQRDVEAKLDIAAVEGSANSLSIPNLKLELLSIFAGNGVKGSISTPVRANLGAKTWDFPKLVANLTFSGLAIPQKSVTLPIQGSVRADLAKQTADGELTTKFDETNVNAKAAASRFDPLVATFDLGVDKLDLDRYLPPDKKESKSDEPLDLSGLRGKTVTGKFAAGALTVKRAKLQNVKADIRLANGKLEVSPQTANLYGGTLSGSVTADANGNRIGIKETAQNVAVGALLRDMAQKDVLEGRGNLNLDVQTAGGTASALKKALAGSARVDMKDGAIKGINLAESVRNAKSLIGGKQQKGDATKKTDFSEASASFKIAGGVARNDDLKVASPFLRMGGAGNLDIGNNTIDYLAKATLAATAKGQGGRDAKDVAGVTLPIKLTGALDNPAWNVDYSALIGSAAVGGITETIKKSAGGAGSAGGGVGGAVRGLFKR